MDAVGGAWETLVEEDKCIEIYNGKPEGKKQLGRPARKWEDYIINGSLVNVMGWHGLVLSCSGQGHLLRKQ
jgi:hypothetical protein